MKNISKTKNYLKMKKLNITSVGVNHWFLGSFLFLFFSLILVIALMGFLKDSSGVWLSVVDFVLFVAVPILIQKLNKIDQHYDKRLKNKHTYVSITVNSRGGLVVAGFYVFYSILFLFFPVIGFIFILPLPFIASIYRVRIKDKIVFPSQG